MNFISHKPSLLLILATTVSGLLNYFLLQTDNGWFFFVLPPLLWSLALLLPIHRTLKDKTFAYMLIPPTMFCLWLAMVLMAITLGRILFSISTHFAYPIIGGIAAWASYGLYAKLAVPHFSTTAAGFCFAMGYFAFVLESVIKSTDTIFIDEQNVIFIIWQSLAGIGHAFAFYKTCIAKDESVNS